MLDKSGAVPSFAAVEGKNFPSEIRLIKFSYEERRLSAQKSEP